MRTSLLKNIRHRLTLFDGMAIIGGAINLIVVTTIFAYWLFT
jgi:hypothetical protein